MAIQNIKRRKQPTVQDKVGAAQLFIKEWCMDCKVGLSLINPIDGYSVTAPCPEEMWKTCPLLLKIQAVKEKEEEFYAAIRPDA